MLPDKGFLKLGFILSFWKNQSKATQKVQVTQEDPLTRKPQLVQKVPSVDFLSRKAQLERIHRHVNRPII